MYDWGPGNCIYIDLVYVNILGVYQYNFKFYAKFDERQPAPMFEQYR